jgi:hypothetical protein
VIEQLTTWRANNRDSQQAENAARHLNYSLPEEPRIGIVNKLKMQQGTDATHILKSQ